MTRPCVELFQFQIIITLITSWPALAKRGIAIGAVCGGGSCGGGGGIPYRPRGITVFVSGQMKLLFDLFEL